SLLRWFSPRLDSRPTVAFAPTRGADAHPARASAQSILNLLALPSLLRAFPPNADTVPDSKPMGNLGRAGLWPGRHRSAEQRPAEDVAAQNEWRRALRLRRPG